MAKIEFKININPVWLTEQTDLSDCTTCGDKIYGKMYRLWIMPYAGNLALKGHSTDMVVCESCYELAKNN